MTQIFGPAQAGGVQKATHAFVIGVGDYPYAKPEMGKEEKLRGVRDLPSAADSAKLMCDWLIANKDKLAAPLGSIEVLISDVPGGATRYAPREPALLQPIDRADGTTIPAAGLAWLNRINQDPGCTALFYACGHGANHGASPVLFHSDLNLHMLGGAWAHLNVGSMALAFRQMPDLAAGFFFLDACGEFVPGMPSRVSDNYFIQPEDPNETDRDKVWLFAAASPGVKAYPGANINAVGPVVPETQFDDVPPRDTESPDVGLVKFGRFTQTLLKGLNGAVARWAGEWCVDNMALGAAALKTLHRIYFPSWNDRPFEPTDVLTINDRVTIIRHPSVALPVLVLTDPANLTDKVDLKISLTNGGEQPWVKSRPKREATPWPTHVDGDINALFYALAIDDAGNCHPRFFIADQPHFDHRVPIK
ncbi:hypothetical protein QTN93_15095 [Sphingomonas aerolata]|uniref:hypothetical protein n=1 Tax=Sphingomonas aerolata TaxID=185951 RepID=UPI0035A649A7